MACSTAYPLMAAEYCGQVTFGGLPVPGATVVATRDGKTQETVTDSQGSYSLPDLGDGTWAISIRMTGFAEQHQDVAVGKDMAAAHWELQLLTLDQMRVEAKAVKPELLPAPSAIVAAATATAAAPAKDGKPRALKATAAAPVDDATQQRAADGLMINGSVNNAASSPYALVGAFGNVRNNWRNLYNGSFGVILDNSALDARPFSISGLQVPKTAYNRFTGVATFGGPIRIRHLVRRGPNFFLAYQWTRQGTATTDSALVPTAAERLGDFSGVLNALGQPVQIFNPATGQPVSGSVGPLSPQALALLSFYPLPNLAGSAQYNYQVPILGTTHEDNLQSRLEKSIGKRDDVYGGFAFQSTRASQANLFGFNDRTGTLGINSNVNWSHRFKQRLFVTSGYTFSRSRTTITPYFENRTNVSQAAGITGNDQDATNWGPPSLAFSSGIAGLGDGQSSRNRSETNAVSESATWTRLHQTITFGGDLRRQEFNYLAQQNPRGTFTFTGAATAGNAATAAGSTGSDFADFLLGVPDASAIAYGNADKYLRQSVYDLYIADDWRVRPELTFNVGVRYEYGGPIVELKNRLVNLDVASGFTAVAPVLASAPLGALTGQAYPNSLIRPDRRGIEPRLGVSWRPIPGSSLVMRGGYGIYDDTSVYQATALNMAQQAPLSKSLSVANSTACPLTLADGFLPCAEVTPQTFAVDPNFRVGYAQTWQLAVQRDLPASLVMTATYLGIKGTRGVQQSLPNTNPIGAGNPCPTCPSGFNYRTSNGNSTREAGMLQLRRRLRSGLTASLQYTYSKSIDDDAQLGGQGAGSRGAGGQSGGSAVTAQDWRNLSAERGLSTFDQRHLLNAQAQYTTGMGIGGHSLMSGWKGTVYKEWTFVTDISAGTGLPESPVYLATIGGTGTTNIERPNLTGASLYRPPAGFFLNSAAFTAPPAGQWGSARRNSITGPGQFTLNGSMSRTFRLKDRYSLDARLDATNLLNHVAYSGWVTTVNSTQFGLPAAAGAMRSLQATIRVRF